MSPNDSVHTAHTARDRRSIPSRLHGPGSDSPVLTGRTTGHRQWFPPGSQRCMPWLHVPDRRPLKKCSTVSLTRTGILCEVRCLAVAVRAG